MKSRKRTISIILSCALLLSLAPKTVFAKSISTTAKYGATWRYTSLDTSEYNKPGVTLLKGKPIRRIDTVIYLSPGQVAELSGKLLNQQKAQQKVSAIKSVIYAGGTEVIKKALITELGSKIAGFINPIIGVAGWTATVISIVDAFANSYYIENVGSAAQAGKGLVIEYFTTQERNGNYTGLKGITISKWDGSSRYGAYPNIVTPLAHNGQIIKGENSIVTTAPSGDSYPGYAISYGSTGTTVKKVQQRLNYWGFAISADASFGPATKNAVLNFQKSRGLSPDGYCGPTTWSKLFSQTFKPTYPGYAVNYGSTGTIVIIVQARLNQLGYNLGSPDGSFGPATKNAILNFQKSRGLNPDGYCGPATWSKLF